MLLDLETERENTMNTTALPTRTEVAIVGAGPTGLALAVTLASAGIEFVIVDRLTEGANTSRAAVVHARTLERLVDAGVRFVTTPHVEPNGPFADFLDVAGNRWDLLGPQPE